MSLAWLYVCHADKRIFQVHKGGPDARLLTTVVSCPICREDITLESTVPEIRESYLVTTHTPREFYVASMGHGFPNEQDASVESVGFWLLGGTITNVELNPAPSPERSLLTRITVSKGGQKATIYLGMSVHGPTVYKLIVEDQ